MTYTGLFIGGVFEPLTTTTDDDVYAGLLVHDVISIHEASDELDAMAIAQAAADEFRPTLTDRTVALAAAQG